MIIFDVGGTLFDDGKFSARPGLEALLEAAVNPSVTDITALCNIWDDYRSEIDETLESQSGLPLDTPLPCAIRYATMKAGLHFDISMPEQEEIFDRYNSSRKVIDGVEELLKKLDSLGIRSAVISNNELTGEALALSLDHWIPSNKFEFCLSSADILLKKPHHFLFEAAVSFAGLDPEECWYCGDGFNPDVRGASSISVFPVLYDKSSPVPLEIHKFEDKNYMVVNHWDALTDFLTNI